jgi:HSP20 family molecular chaperone IbpA
MSNNEVATDRTATRREAPALLPPVNVVEDAGGITLTADLPGVPRDRLSLQIEADTLTIEGDIVVAMPDGMDATHAEVSVPRYRRSFTLSKELDSSSVSAEFAHGVLRLRIPKAPHAQPRRIEIEAA